DVAAVVPRRGGRAGSDAAAVYLSGACRSRRHLLVSDRCAGPIRPGRRPAAGHLRGPGVTTLAPTLQAFFTERLINQRRVSRHTLLAYRDAFRLLLGFVHARTGKPPNELDLTDLDAAAVSAFLDHLEHDRHNSARTRNLRLAAMHSLFGYAALRHPEHAELIQRVLAIPPKRFERAEV